MTEDRRAIGSQECKSIYNLRFPGPQNLVHICMGFVLKYECEFPFCELYLLRSELSFSNLNLLINKMRNDGVISGAKLLMMCLAQCLTYECSTYKYNSCATAGGVGGSVVKL